MRRRTWKKCFIFQEHNLCHTLYGGMSSSLVTKIIAHCDVSLSSSWITPTSTSFFSCVWVEILKPGPQSVSHPHTFSVVQFLGCFVRSSCGMDWVLSFMTDASGERCSDVWLDHHTDHFSPLPHAQQKDWEGIGEKKGKTFFFLKSWINKHKCLCVTHPATIRQIHPPVVSVPTPPPLRHHLDNFPPPPPGCRNPPRVEFSIIPGNRSQRFWIKMVSYAVWNWVPDIYRSCL